MDLRTELPRLLPGAITWAQSQATHVAESGIALNAAGLDLARRMGVVSPERIRLKVVRALPLPDDPTLRAAAVEAGLLGPNMVGLTLGHSIFVCDGHVTARLISHECRHVQQYEAQGSIEAFLPVYLAQVITLGYANAPCELDARAHEFSA